MSQSRLLTAWQAINTCALPILVGTFPLGISQAWYEHGGVITTAMYQMIAAGIVFPLYQIMQYAPRPQPPCQHRGVASVHHAPRCRYRYDSVLFKMLPARWSAVSQAKLNEAYRPPPIYFGSLYASSFKAIALCLVYSPFWPPAYLLTAALLVFSWLCTKLALRYWRAQQPAAPPFLMLHGHGGLASTIHIWAWRNLAGTTSHRR